MPIKCIVCDKFGDFDTTLHGFPNDPEMKAKWFKILNLNPAEIKYAKLHLCSNHFRKKDYCSSVPGSFRNYGRLKKTALPQPCPITKNQDDTVETSTTPTPRIFTSTNKSTGFVDWVSKSSGSSEIEQPAPARIRPRPTITPIIPITLPVQNLPIFYQPPMQLAPITTPAPERFPLPTPVSAKVITNLPTAPIRTSCTKDKEPPAPGKFTDAEIQVLVNEYEKLSKENTTTDEHGNSEEIWQTIAKKVQTVRGIRRPIFAYKRKLELVQKGHGGKLAKSGNGKGSSSTNTQKLTKCLFCSTEIVDESEDSTNSSKITQQLALDLCRVLKLDKDHGGATGTSNSTNTQSQNDFHTKLIDSPLCHSCQEKAEPCTALIQQLDSIQKQIGILAEDLKLTISNGFNQSSRSGEAEVERTCSLRKEIISQLKLKDKEPDKPDEIQVELVEVEPPQLQSAYTKFITLGPAVASQTLSNESPTLKNTIFPKTPKYTNAMKAAKTLQRLRKFRTIKKRIEVVEVDSDFEFESDSDIAAIVSKFSAPRHIPIPFMIPKQEPSDEEVQEIQTSNNNPGTVVAQPRPTILKKPKPKDTSESKSFTEVENQILESLYKQYESQINSKLTQRRIINVIWRSITSQVNRVGGNQRTIEDVQVQIAKLLHLKLRKTVAAVEEPLSKEK